MSQQTDLRRLTLAGIAHRCTQETERFFQRLSHDPRYCFELFRRAIVQRNQHAWEHLYTQYQPLVTGWVRQHPAYPNTGEEAQYLSNRAFEKMWAALTPAKFSHFSDLKSLLRYLQMCVHSTVLDVVRANKYPVVEAQVETLAVKGGSSVPPVEHAALEQVQRQELWHAIEARLHNDQERRVVYGSFILALKPRELYAEYQDMFRDVTEVYRVKENVLARLRRDAELQKLFGQDA